jgi:hypothetical protein
MGSLPLIWQAQASLGGWCMQLDWSRRRGPSLSCQEHKVDEATDDHACPGEDVRPRLH